MTRRRRASPPARPTAWRRHAPTRTVPGSQRSPEHHGGADGVVAGLDEAFGAGIPRRALDHLVHDVAETKTVLRVGKTNRAAGPCVPERPRSAIGGKRRADHEPQPEGRPDLHAGY